MSQNLKTLKCPNCGSSIFEQLDFETYKCEHCSSVVKDNNAEKASFIKFLNSKSQKQSNIYFVTDQIGKKNFFDNAISYIALDKYSPKDIFSADFDNVKTRYKQFLVVRAEFQVVKLNNSYFKTVEPVLDSSAKISLSSNEELEESIFNESYSMCSSLEENSSPIECQKVFGDISATNLNMRRMSAVDLNTSDIKLVSKSKISSEIDRIISNAKINILKTQKDKDIKIMHTISSIELYIVPEYYLQYKYQNENYEVSSFAYNLNILGTIPNSSKELNKVVLKKTRVFSLISMIFSLLCIIFALVSLGFARYSKLAKINFVAIPVMLFVFALTFLIDRTLTKNILRERYDFKKQEMTYFLKKHSRDYSNKDEILSLLGEDQ